MLDYLRARELITHVYFEITRRIRLESGVHVKAVTYVVDRTHQQYAGAMPVDVAYGCVRGAQGQSGPNEEYVVNTAEHLRTLGIRDHHLETVARQIRADAGGVISPGANI